MISAYVSCRLPERGSHETKSSLIRQMVSPSRILRNNLLGLWASPALTGRERRLIEVLGISFQGVEGRPGVSGIFDLGSVDPAILLLDPSFTLGGVDVG